MKVIALVNYVRYFLRKISDDYVNAFSAQAAFFIIISFFPFAMFLLTMLQYLPILPSSVLRYTTNILPTAVTSLVITVLDEIYAKASGTIISITAVTALWSASRGFLAIVKGLNSVYEIKETRNYIKLRIISTLYTLVFAILIILTLAILVFGNRLYIWITARIPMLGNFALLIISIRTILGLTILISFFLMLYIFIPNRKSRFIYELPGAIVSAAGWLGFSYLYSFYIDNMGNYSYMYGSLTAIVLLMLWLYFCMYIMFVGAEVNMFLINTPFIKRIERNRSRKKSEDSK